MLVEISKKQKELIAEKIELCVEFLKKQIQPYLSTKDKISVGVGNDLELVITPNELYVKEIRIFSLIIDIYHTRTLYLEKSNSKKANKYICDSFPEQAIDFLKHWEKTKKTLLEEVAKKDSEIAKLDNFINGFHL